MLNIYYPRNFIYIANNTRLPDGTFCIPCGGKLSPFLLFKVRKRGTDSLSIYCRIPPQKLSKNIKQKLAYFNLFLWRGKVLN